MKKGMSLVELIVIMLIVAIAAVMFLSMRDYRTAERSKQVKCKANLDQIGKHMALYLYDFGDAVRYPKANGEGFLVTLYQERVLQEADVFICPSTPDLNDNGADLATVRDEGDADGPCSYAGRKNREQLVYPGIFRPDVENHTTPMAADDWNDGVVENHQNGEILIFLFLDGHTDYIRSSGADFVKGFSLTYDPLTN